MTARYIGTLTPVSKALELLAEKTAPVREAYRVPLRDAAWSVLAEDIHAPHDWPPRHKSAYDGYAVRSSDTPGRLRLVGEALIGESDVGFSIGPGEAAYVTTGAYLPEGADAVVPEERVRVENGYVIVDYHVEKYKNIDPAGSMVRKGQLLARRGQLLSSLDVAALYEVAVTEATVYRRVRTAIISTGNELILPGDPLWTREMILSGKVVATTGGLISWFISDYLPWVEVAEEILLPDERESVAWWIKRLLPHVDLILLTGGTGPSNIDLFYQLQEELGGEIVFRGLYVKGGRPTSAYIAEGKPVIGLSGYPLSALHGFIRLVYPYLRYLGNVARGAPPVPLVKARLTEAIGKGRPRPIKVRVEVGEEGYLATPLQSTYQLSSANVGLVYADGIAFVSDREYGPGDVVDVLLIRDPRGYRPPMP